MTALFVTPWASTAPPLAVGMPAGHATAPWLETVCVSVALSFPEVTEEPVKTGAVMVPAGVPALLASDSPTVDAVVLAVGAA